MDVTAGWWAWFLFYCYINLRDLCNWNLSFRRTVVIVIIILMSCWYLRVLHLSLTKRSYRPSFVAVLPDSILCLYRTDISKSLLVSRCWSVDYELVSILQQGAVCLVYFTMMVCEMGGKLPYVCFCGLLLTGFAQSSKLHCCVVFFQRFFLYLSLKSNRYYHTVL